MFLIAAGAACLHFWQLHQIISLRRELQSIEHESVFGHLDDVGEAMFADPETRERIAREAEQRSRNLEETHNATQGELSFAFAVSIIAFWATPLFLAMAFATHSPASNQTVASTQTFISYNHRNLAEATVLKSDLESCGHSITLIDQILDVSGDRELAEILTARITGTDVMLVLLTPDSLASNWVGFERMLGDAHLQKILYVCDGVSLFAAIWRTHFLNQKHAGFKVIKSLKAKRRYVNLKGPRALDLVSAHISGQQRRADVILSLKQFAYSFGSLDQMLLNALFNFCENGMLTNQSRSWRFGMLFCTILQATFFVAPFFMLMWIASFLVAIFS